MHEVESLHPDSTGAGDPGRNQPGMWLGIDVGGTYTDAVVLEGGRVLAAAKRPTSGDLLQGILGALDEVLKSIEVSRIERVAFSTTVVTNALLEGTIDPVTLLLLPGPGMSTEGLVPGEPVILSGSVDHRGREGPPPPRGGGGRGGGNEVRSPDEDEVAQALNGTEKSRALAVSGKFSIRNPGHERAVAEQARALGFTGPLCLGSQMSGSLNFLRRSNSAWYNAAVWRRFGAFAAAMEKAMQERHVSAPLYVLKADGGTLPLESARSLPVEAIFTGPAASVLGILAMAPPEGEAVSVDIGGTSTDIALWREGAPILADKGARVGGFVTSVRAFDLHSVGIGGDSWVRREEGKLLIGPTRRGAAMAMGGSDPTVSDAMIVAERAAFGDAGRAGEAMRSLAVAGQSGREVAEEILQAAVARIAAEIEAMIERRASEPVYRVEDIVHPQRLQPQRLVGVGGAAAALVPLLAQRMGVAWSVPPQAMVANAVGAAVARPTLEITLRADTAEHYYTVPELGLRRELPGQRFGPADAQRRACEHLAERAAQAGIEVADVETVHEECFNLVRGFSTVGRIMTCRVQIRPGVLTRVEGAEVKL